MLRGGGKRPVSPGPAGSDDSSPKRGAVVPPPGPPPPRMVSLVRRAPPEAVPAPARPVSPAPLPRAQAPARRAPTPPPARSLENEMTKKFMIDHLIDLPGGASALDVLRQNEKLRRQRGVHEQTMLYGLNPGHFEDTEFKKKMLGFREARLPTDKDVLAVTTRKSNTPPYAGQIRGKVVAQPTLRVSAGGVRIPTPSGHHNKVQHFAGMYGGDSLIDQTFSEGELFPPGPRRPRPRGVGR